MAYSNYRFVAAALFIFLPIIGWYPGYKAWKKAKRIEERSEKQDELLEKQLEDVDSGT